MTRATYAVIDTAALQHNLQLAHQAAPDSKIMAIIKADAYGHGMIQAANALAAADSFGVACLEEALCLREARVDKPIVLLEGFTRADELKAIAQHGFECVIHHSHQIDALAQVDSDPIALWLKIDTGMHRLGFRPEQALAAYRQLSQLSCAGPIRLMTHLANADDREDPATDGQLDLFANVTGQLPPAAAALERSVANSAGVLGWPGSHAQWNRPGIMLYGVSPFNRGVGTDLGLKPVMSVHSEIIAINQHRRGDRVGYGGTWQCPEDMTVGVVAMGYGDGYPRHAPTGTPVLINGRRVPLVGRVSMDMITVDLRDQPQVDIGEPVQLWGAELPVEEVAHAADTIAYELLCGLTQRVRYRYQ
jgi:alanine racemase